MPIPALVALRPLTAALIVVLTTSPAVGCAHWIGADSGQALHTPSSSPASSVAGTGPSGSKSPAPPTTPGAMPASGAPISDVISWVEAGRPADPGRYHGATRDGTTTPLGTDVAFTGQGGKTSCMTDTQRAGTTLDCLIELSSPPPRPDTAYGQWIGGWTTFDGVNLQVGAARADPGPFLNGNGAELANGETLSFGDYRCRGDAAGVICVNYAHQSAARFSVNGVEPYGCLRSVPAPDGVGVALNCS